MTASLPADIFEAMHELLHLFRARMREDLDTLGTELTPNEVRVLMFVGRHPGRTQKDLVDHSHMDKAQLARMLAQLQEQGWLDREPDARDRRAAAADATAGAGESQRGSCALINRRSCSHAGRRRT
jgi:DNA-binding MarR family transcriptional regulator